MTTLIQWDRPLGFLYLTHTDLEHESGTFFGLHLEGSSWAFKNPTSDQTAAIAERLNNARWLFEQLGKEQAV